MPVRNHQAALALKHRSAPGPAAPVSARPGSTGQCPARQHRSAPGPAAPGQRPAGSTGSAPGRQHRVSARPRRHRVSARPRRHRVGARPGSTGSVPGPAAPRQRPAPEAPGRRPARQHPVGARPGTPAGRRHGDAHADRAAPVLPKPRMSCVGSVAPSARKALMPYTPTERSPAAATIASSAAGDGRWATARNPAARPLSLTRGACAASAPACVDGTHPAHMAVIAPGLEHRRQGELIEPRGTAVAASFLVPCGSRSGSHIFPDGPAELVYAPA